MSERPEHSIRLTYIKPSGKVYGSSGPLEAPMWWGEITFHTGAQILERLIETLGTAPGLFGDAESFMVIIDDLYTGSVWFAHARDPKAREDATKAGGKLWAECGWGA